MEAYKIGVTVPLGTEQGFMDALDGYFSPLYPGYDHVYSWWETEGSWRPLKGSHPHQGEIGRIERAREVRIEFAVRAEDAGRAVRRIAEIHPFEEPAVDVMPLVPWKDVAARDDS